MTRRTGALIAAAAVVALTIAAFAARGRDAGAPAGPPPAADPAPPPPAPEAADPATVPAGGEAGPSAAQLELPDGTFVPALNGAVGAPPLAESWGTRPWSPIARVERSDRGVDWYVHEDGTRSTTEMRWRSDLGRYDAVTRIAVPVADAPPVGSAR